MICPKCKGKLVCLNIHGYEIDRCSICKGLWFDSMECDEMKLLDNPEAVDIGDPMLGRNYNKVEKANCPRCYTPMIKLSPADNPEFAYDGCLGCRGVFFDAGEFKDYIKYNSVISFKNFVPKKI